MAASWMILAVPFLVVAVVAQRPSYSEYKDAQANASQAKDAAAAKDAKMAAVSKVVTMLKDLQTQVMSEGEKESQTYNKFACFCKDTTTEKSDQIQKSTDEKASLTSAISTLSEERVGLDEKIAGLIESIATEEKAVKAAEAKRAADHKTYKTNEEDLRLAVAALDAAVKSLKASKAASLLQLREQISRLPAVRQALAMADAFGFSGAARATATLLQNDATAEPDVPTENYKFHSDDIIGTLEGLHKDFKDEKATVDAAEVQAATDHDAFLQEKTDIIKQHNLDLDTSKKSKAKKQEEIGSKSGLLSTVAATLLDDQEYLKGLSEMCSKKAQTWDQRSKVRQDELSALTAAITIIESTVSEKTSAATIRFAQQGVSVQLAEAAARSPERMEMIEAAVEADEAASPSFLQHASSRQMTAPAAAIKVPRSPGVFLAKVESAPARAAKDAQEKVAELIRSRGSQLHSPLLSALAGRIAQQSMTGEDVFAKVKVLIQELIERLLQEASNEAGHKGWCDKSLADARQKRENAAEQVTELNGNMAELEATRDKLKMELEELEKIITELITKRTEAEEMRANEKTENEATVTEAKEGLSAVSQAIDILDKFYKTSAKSAVEYSLTQQSPTEDAPNAGFDAGEAYTGAQGEAGGVIGMLTVISSDFERTISETEAAEAQAVQDHLVFMTDTGKSLAAKNVAKTEKTTQLDDTETTLTSTEENMKTQMEIITSKIKELLELKPVCIDTGMTYDERIGRREEEMESLKKALCILEQYEQYGEAGASGAACFP